MMNAKERETMHAGRIQPRLGLNHGRLWGWCSRRLLIVCTVFWAFQPEALAQLGRNDDVGSPFTVGDAIRITIPTDTTSFVNGIYRIDQNGYVKLPLLGPTHVTAMSVREVASVVDTTFARYLSFPDVRVEPLVRVAFVGGFYNPGLYYVDPDLSLWDALALSGGPQRQDGISRLRWERDGEVISKDLTREVASGQSLRGIGFQSGDQITVTTRPERTAWDVFRVDVLPVLSITISTIATTMTLIGLLSED